MRKATIKGCLYFEYNSCSSFPLEGKYMEEFFVIIRIISITNAAIADKSSNVWIMTIYSVIPAALLTCSNGR